MPEFSWENLGPNARTGSGTVNKTGPGWDAVIGKSEAGDPAFHEALPPPVEIVRAVPETSPPPPSDLELRDTLRTAIAAEIEAKTVRDDAHAAHERAKGLVETSSQTLANFTSPKAKSPRRRPPT
jgi:hypothetical protein